MGALVNIFLMHTIKKVPNPGHFFGGADGTQTHDLYDANVALYQLSYNPKTVVRIRGLEPPRHCCH